ncbi:MAG: hypothetical protein R3D71_04185 [Rickettsiales bacterium]
MSISIKQNIRFIKICTILSIFIMFVLSSFAYGKEQKAKNSEDLSFHGQCPKLLAMADDFAKECLEKARSREGMTYPYPKMGGIPYKVTGYAPYFRAIDNGSNFGLGCSLDTRRRIMFLGIFYSTKSGNFAVANTLPVFNSLGAGGDVTLQKTADKNGELVNFIAVRQFRTNFIKPVMGGGEMAIKNCENEQLADGRIRMNHVETPRKIVKNIDDKGRIMIRKCDGHEVLCVAEYLRFFPSNDQRIIYQGDHDSFFITSGGDLLVKKNWLARNCKQYKSNPRSLYDQVCNIIHSPISKKDKK